MKKLIIALFILIGINSLAFAVPSAQIKDVAKDDPALPAINSAIHDGYLSLFQDTTFQGQQPVCRKEIAVILDRLLRGNNSQKLSLTSIEIQELSNLSRIFKNYLANNDVQTKEILNRLTACEEEQKVLHTDLTSLKDELATLKKENQDQHFYMIIGIIVAGIFGIIIH